MIAGDASRHHAGGTQRATTVCPVAPPSPAVTVAVGLVGLGLGLTAFALRGSPLYQSTTIWQIYNSLFGPPLALWLLERWSSPRRGLRGAALDVIVVLIVAARSRGLVPLVSGHGMLLVYVVATTARRPTQTVAIVALAAATAFKVLAWHNGVSVLAGAAAGGAFALVWRRQSVVGA